MAWVLQRPELQLSPEGHIAAAALHGDMAMCQFLHSQQSPWDKECTHHAAISGNLDLLRWFIHSGCPWNAQELCTAAAEGGSVEVLNYLQQLGLLTSTALFTLMLSHVGSALFGTLAAAKWLRQQGAEWPTAFHRGRPWSSAVQY
eukprot:1257-Heterococcus_DN1.PRE.1